MDELLMNSIEEEPHRLPISVLATLLGLGPQSVASYPAGGQELQEEKSRTFHEYFSAARLELLSRCCRGSRRYV